MQTLSSKRNREIYRGDCLDILSDYELFPSEFVDLIYLDPPFNSNAVYNLPFSKADRKDFEAVAAFEDTWIWGATENKHIEALRTGDSLDQSMVKVVELALEMRGTRGKDNIAAYLINMGVRLKHLKRVLKGTGSIWLHCDPTASHYLKMLMDVVFGSENFRNDVSWCYTSPSNTKRWFPRKHDCLLFYVKDKEYAYFDTDNIRVPYKESFTMGGSGSLTRGAKTDMDYTTGRDEQFAKGKIVEDYWIDIPSLSVSSERLGYPTQKPLKLANRIIYACTKPDDLVLDPFCGCGTTLYSAEMLDRRWIGVDISRYSASLAKNRLLADTDNFKARLKPNNIKVYGLPTTDEEARKLVAELGHQQGRFEFEKWVCGVLGTSNIIQRKAPGKPGADGEVDGLLKFFPIRTEAITEKQRAVEEAYAVIQAKSGNVTPDAVRALTQVIEDTPGAVAAILVAFDDQRTTFVNNASTKTIEGILGDYRKVQFLSVRDILNLPQNPTFLPNIHKMGGRTEPIQLPGTESPHNVSQV